MAMKKVKKGWIEVFSPKEFGSVELGTCYCLDPQDLIGRKMKINLMHLTKEIKKQNTRVTFELNAVRDGKVFTDVSAYEIIPAHVRKITKRNKSKVEDSFSCLTKDNVKLIVKPLIITKSLSSNPKLTEIRKKTREVLAKMISDKSYPGFVKSVLSNEIQKGLTEELKRITPINISLIRQFSIIK